MSLFDSLRKLIQPANSEQLKEEWGMPSSAEAPTPVGEDNDEELVGIDEHDTLCKMCGTVFDSACNSCCPSCGAEFGGRPHYTIRTRLACPKCGHVSLSDTCMHDNTPVSEFTMQKVKICRVCHSTFPYSEVECPVCWGSIERYCELFDA